MLSSQIYNIRRTRFDHSSPVQPVSENQGGQYEPDGRRRRRTEAILVSNIGWRVSYDPNYHSGESLWTLSCFMFSVSLFCRLHWSYKQETYRPESDPLPLEPIRGSKNSQRPHQGGKNSQRPHQGGKNRDKQEIGCRGWESVVVNNGGDKVAA